jgi:uncharacterized coiled-coil protein SlyX
MRSTLFSLRVAALIAVATALLAFLPTLRAVTPAPDGGYANANTAEGTNALFELTTGTNNTAIGNIALFLDTTGGWNTGVGSLALFNNSSGNFNTAVGWRALVGNNTGSNNIGIGINAGQNLNQGNNNNIEIGNKGDSFDFNVIRIGTPSTHQATFIAGISGVTVSGATVCVGSDGQLGECAPAGGASTNSINNATAMARKVEEQAGRIAEQEKAIAALTATVKQQTAQIQKVSAELTVMKTKPQLVSNQK